MKALSASLIKACLLLMALSSAVFATESVDTTLEPGTAGTITGPGTSTTTTTTTTSPSGGV